mgnify:CR=1 FL=1
MEQKTSNNLLKTVIPLLVYCGLLYQAFFYTDKKPLSYEAFIFIFLSAGLLYYLVNFRLIYVGSRIGVIALLVIMLIAIGIKMYVIRIRYTPRELIGGYGLLMASVLFSGFVFTLRHIRLRILESVSLYTDKQEYVLGEAVNYSVEIEPRGRLYVKKLEIALIMSENSSAGKLGILDEVMYREERILAEDTTFTASRNMNGSFVIPPGKMSSYFGQYNSIFWYLKISISSGKLTLEDTVLINVKPEILLRAGTE